MNEIERRRLQQVLERNDPEATSVVDLLKIAITKLESGELKATGAIVLLRIEVDDESFDQGSFHCGMTMEQALAQLELAKFDVLAGDW